jgi:hypothetical protein
MHFPSGNLVLSLVRSLVSIQGPLSIDNDQTPIQTSLRKKRASFVAGIVELLVEL